MCKICDNCKGIMNYDPYFEAEICSKCGKIERKKSKETVNLIAEQAKNLESLKSIFQTVAMR